MHRTDWSETIERVVIVIAPVIRADFDKIFAAQIHMMIQCDQQRPNIL